MSRLSWTERSHGWHAGPYEIELAAPGLWVCSRKGRLDGDVPTILMTSGSLSALKARVERAEVRRRLALRSFRYGAIVVFALTVVGAASMSAHQAAPAVVVVFSVLGVFCALRAIDGLIKRSWESLSVNYQ